MCPAFTTTARGIFGTPAPDSMHAPSAGGGPLPWRRRDRPLGAERQAGGADGFGDDRTLPCADYAEGATMAASNAANTGEGHVVLVAYLRSPARSIRTGPTVRRRRSAGR